VTIYPHGGVALLKIAKVWTLTLMVSVGCLVAQHYLPAQSGNVLSYVAIALWVGAVIFAAHQFLHYANTYVTISEDAVVYRKGWIPNVTDTIFWVNIKDVNTSTSLGEGLLGSGTITLVVAIRNMTSIVTIPYIPDHEIVASGIRNKVAQLNEATRQVTYT
jgi:membrane protein YdbS with pleckstrin-like domain